MAPMREVSTSADEMIPAFPAPPTGVSTHLGTGTRTPEQSPNRRPMGLSLAQKQALVDNLQLEITERARKLRAQYALQAQGLRSRLEMRVNRIPQALRKKNMQELIEEHTEKAKPLPPAPMPVARDNRTMQAVDRAVVQPGSKRKSDDISTGNDKENMPSRSIQDLDNPKKRSKTAAATANTKATRTTSRKVGPTGVLSPKSHNSRTLPRSPLKSAHVSPEKPLPARPTVSTQTTLSKASTRAPSRQFKNPVGMAGVEGRDSEASTTSSAGTTIVTKPGTKKTVAVPKKTVSAAKPTASVGRKVAAAKKETAPVATGRTLRKRN